MINKMNWEKEIVGLKDPQLKRIRKTIIHFSPQFKEKGIPFHAPIPKDTGFCRRPLPRDYLIVVGTLKSGNTKKINCGCFSQELLNRVNQKIKSEPNAPLYGDNTRF